MAKVRAINQSDETFEYTFDSRYPPPWPPNEIRELDIGEYVVALRQSEIKDEHAGVSGYKIREIGRQDVATMTMPCPYEVTGLCHERGMTQQELIQHITQVHGPAGTVIDQAAAKTKNEAPFTIGRK